MNRFRVTFRPEALAQLDELYDYIAEASSAASAADFTHSIVAYCDELADFPLRGRSRDDLRPGLRILGYRRRVVIAFAVLGESVVIIGILYGGRDFESLLGDASQLE